MELAPGAVEIRPEDFLHRVLDLWQSIDAIRHGAGTDMLASATMLRVDLLTQEPPEDQATWQFLFPSAEPDVNGESWQSIGYDVANGSLTSGLSNCGDREKIAALRSQWAGKVNEHGLIADLEDAFAYCKVTDVRVREHAPFFVLELFQPTYWPSRTIV